MPIEQSMELLCYSLTLNQSLCHDIFASLLNKQAKHADVAVVFSNQHSKVFYN